MSENRMCPLGLSNKCELHILSGPDHGGSVNPDSCRVGQTRPIHDWEWQTYDGCFSSVISRFIPGHENSRLDQKNLGKPYIIPTQTRKTYVFDQFLHQEIFPVLSFPGLEFDTASLGIMYLSPLAPVNA